MNAFYSAVVSNTNGGNKYWAMLSQYHTGSPAQTLNYGSLGTPYVDSNAATGTVTDAQVQARLTALFNAGKLVPTANTYYPVHFPPGLTIKDSSNTASCTVWCAYHGTFTYNGNYVYYGILPDQGGSCAGGCGSDPVILNNLQSVSSHELAETATDAGVGLAANYAAPLAWYDQTNGYAAVLPRCCGSVL